MNLVTNALQAMPQGGEINISSEVKDKNIEVKIKDTGVGIPPKNLEKLFTPLFTTKSKGIGLGLSNVKNIVEKHGGTIQVQSEEGKGTTFTIQLPLRIES